MRLLIVDDIPLNRKLLRVKLEAEDHTAIEASDGLEALRVLDSEKVDGVVSDILMPRMDGYRLCNEVRANKALRDLPFVFYTSAFVSSEDEKLALSVGADKYLSKPAPVEAILRALQDAGATKHLKPSPGAVREFEVLKVFSDRLVAKLEEKNLELERQLRMRALSADVGAALIHGKTLEESLRFCAAALTQHLDVTSATIWTHDEREDSLDLVAVAGSGPAPDARIARVPVGRFAIGMVAHDRKPCVMEAALECVPDQESIPAADCRIFAAYPVIAGERLFGVVAVFAREAFGEDKLDTIASIADALALGIERKWAEEELRQALAEKTTLLQEVHHRVKNNLQVICSLLSMQIQSSDADVALGPLNEAHGRVVAMSLIHEQIYQSEALTDLNFGDYIKVLSDRVFHAYCVDPSRVRLELSVASIRLTVDQAIACGLILNECLSNSLKHAFKDGRQGVIRVSLAKTETGAELTVADNGVGFSEDFRWQESRSLGLKVVHTLAKQVRGELAVSGEGGATFRLSWRIAPDGNVTPPSVPHRSKPLPSRTLPMP